MIAEQESNCCKACDKHLPGGVAVYVHESISYKIRSDLMPNNLKWSHLRLLIASSSHSLSHQFTEPRENRSLISMIWKLYWLLFLVNGSRAGSLHELHPGRRCMVPQQVRKPALFPAAQQEPKLLLIGQFIHVTSLAFT